MEGKVHNEPPPKMLDLKSIDWGAVHGALLFFYANFQERGNVNERKSRRKSFFLFLSIIHGTASGSAVS